MQIDLEGFNLWISSIHPVVFLHFGSRGVVCEFYLLNKVNPSSGGSAVWQELDPADLPGSCGYAGSKVPCAVKYFQN